MATSCLPFSIAELAPSSWALVGELDINGVRLLESQLAGWHGDVWLDCSGLTFVDASGLGMFVRIRKVCESRGVRFALVSPSRCVRRVLAITGLDTVFLNGLDGPAL